MDSSSMTIGQLANTTGVGVSTFRFYERQGLIPDPPRRRSGYRQYPPETVARLLFIKRAKELGFSLREILELLSLRVDPDKTCTDVKDQAEQKIRQIETKMKSLRRMKRALAELAASCTGSGPTSECPILDALGALGDPQEIL